MCLICVNYDDKNIKFIEQIINTVENIADRSNLIIWKSIGDLK